MKSASSQSISPRHSNISKKKSRTPSGTTPTSKHSDDDNIYRFVYSDAVRKAMCKNYRTSALPELLTQPSSISLKQGRVSKAKVVEILKLPQLYTDLKTVQYIRRRNLQVEKEWTTDWRERLIQRRRTIQMEKKWANEWRNNIKWGQNVEHDWNSYLQERAHLRDNQRIDNRRPNNDLRNDLIERDELEYKKEQKSSVRKLPKLPWK